MPSIPYKIRYANEAVDDVRGMRKFDQRKVLEGIEIHLTHQPKFVSKSRIKAMAQPFWRQYRLRVDEFRVYYQSDDTGLRNPRKAWGGATKRYRNTNASNHREHRDHGENSR